VIITGYFVRSHFTHETVLKTPQPPTCKLIISEEKWVLEEGAPFCVRHMTKSPVLSPTKSTSSAVAQQSPVKGKAKIEPLKTIHIDTTSCFDSSDASSVQSPSGSSRFSPISPVKKNVASPKKTPVQSPKKQ